MHEDVHNRISYNAENLDIICIQENAQNLAFSCNGILLSVYNTLLSVYKNRNHVSKQTYFKKCNIV